MGQPIGTTPALRHDHESSPDTGWTLVLAAARSAEWLTQANQFAAFALAVDGQLRPVTVGDPDALIAWRPGGGWETTLPADDPRRALIDLYLPICSATAARPMTVAHLGQSVDGLIATHTGESRWVTGKEDILHSHRLRGLCDAVVVGAGTVATDDPQLTTRLVSGPSPLRVVFDPTRRLGTQHRVFNDESSETIYVCARSLIRPDEDHFGRAVIVGLDERPGGIEMADLVRLLRARGCARVFVEGGGVTVSMFLEANLLDRLHIVIAPVLIGDGRPAIRIPARAALGDCHRPRYRVFRMGGDVLFDFDLSTNGDGRVDAPSDREPPVTRVF